MTRGLKEIIGDNLHSIGRHIDQPPVGFIDRLEFNQSVLLIDLSINQSICSAICSAIVLVTKSMQKKLVIPEWFVATVTVGQLVAGIHFVKVSQNYTKYVN